MFSSDFSYNQRGMTPKEQAEQASEAFPARLKAFRKNANFTQEELAARAECSAVSLTKFETGTSRPTLKILVALSAALDVSVDRLLGLPSDKSGVGEREVAALNRLEQAAVSLPLDWIDAIAEIAQKAARSSKS